MSGLLSTVTLSISLSCMHVCTYIFRMCSLLNASEFSLHFMPINLLGLVYSCVTHMYCLIFVVFFKKIIIQLMLKCKNTFPNQFLLYCNSCMRFKFEMWFFFFFFFFFLSLSLSISTMDFFNQVEFALWYPHRISY